MAIIFLDETIVRKGECSVNLNATDQVGDIWRAEIPKYLNLYRDSLQAVVDDVNNYDHTKKFVNGRLVKLQELSTEWHSTYGRFGAGPAGSAREQEQVENAVRAAEAQLAKEF